MSNMTKQGKSILECFKKNKEVHLTADEVWEALRKNATPVSMATVYRQLEKLTAENLIKKYTLSPDEPACYQYNLSHTDCVNHFHLKCTVCNKLIHVSCDYLNKLEEHINEHHGFEVDNTRTVLYGICSNCRKK